MLVELTKTRQELRTKDDCIKNMERQNGELKRKLTEIKQSLERKLEVQHQRQLKENCSRLKNDYETQLQRYADEYSGQYRTMKERYEEDINTLQKDARTQMEINKMKLIDLRAELKAAEEGKERALSRLSQIAGVRLMDGNPAIADLNDKNRPTIIADKFAELFDNQWTDAFEEIEKLDRGLQEHEIIAKLLFLVMKTFQFCRETAANHLQSMPQSMTDPFYGKVSESTPQNARNLDQDADRSSSLPSLLAEINKQLKDIRKNLVLSITETVCEKFLDQLDISSVLFGTFDIPLASLEKMTTFVRKCVELCWQMGIQDPQVFLYDKCPQHSPFNKEWFRHYTRSGDYVDYLVWPALMLQENGSVLQKGVAQGCKTLPNVEVKKQNFSTTV